MSLPISWEAEQWPMAANGPEGGELVRAARLTLNDRQWTTLCVQVIQGSIHSRLVPEFPPAADQHSHVPSPRSPGGTVRSRCIQSAPCSARIFAGTHSHERRPLSGSSVQLPPISMVSVSWSTSATTGAGSRTLGVKMPRRLPPGLKVVQPLAPLAQAEV